MNDVKDLTQPELRGIAVRCLLLRLLFIPAAIVAAPGLLIATVFVLLQYVSEKICETVWVFAVPYNWVSDLISANYDKAYKIKCGHILPKDDL